MILLSISASLIPEIAKKEIHKIELDMLAKHLYILNIQENNFPQAKPIKTKLKQLRKNSKNNPGWL